MQPALEWIPLLAAALVLTALLGCASMGPSSLGQISRSPFGQLEDGSPVDIFSLRNSKGAEARICNYGGIVVSLKVPDREGRISDVALGYDDLGGYLKKNPYFGAIVGRYANRIGGAKFSLNGKEYTLAANNGTNSLHGGLKGFDKALWEPRILATPAGPALELSYVSKNGEEGFPGNLTVRAVYTMTEDNALKLEFNATTDQETIVNLTQHSYFNLAGHGDVLGHQVMIVADTFTPVDGGLIPTGEFRAVAGTPLDFRTPLAIGARINQDYEQLKLGQGYDHNFVINKPLGQAGLMARVYEPTSGRVLEVFSTEPGMQFYTGNHLDGTIKGKGGVVYKARSGFCMEPGHYPNSPNQPNFPSVVLKPGQVYQSMIMYRFSLK
jgi:aldose 1-epimerase